MSDITSNLNRFFEDFDIHPRGWDGRPRGLVGDEIEVALKAIKSLDIDKLREEYDAPNGWGDIPGAIQFLEQVLADCRYVPPEVPDTVVVD